MNRKRRSGIRKVARTLSDCVEDLSSIKEDEDDTRENVPENLQGSEAYCLSEEYSDTLDEAITNIQEVIDSLEEI